MSVLQHYQVSSGLPVLQVHIPICPTADPRLCPQHWCTRTRGLLSMKSAPSRLQRGMPRVVKRVLQGLCAAPVVHVHERLVAHEERAQQLQRGDLQREVEGRDERDGAERPAHARARLARVVARHRERARREPGLRAAHM